MADKYIYAVARIRALEMTLMSQAVIEQLVATDSYKKAVQFIIEKGWGDSDKASMDENDILRAETDKTWAAVAEMVDDMSVFDVIRLPDLYHNLKAAIKTVVAGETPAHVFFDNAEIDGQKMLSIVSDKAWDRLPEHMRDCAREAWDCMAQAGDGQMCDAVIDRGTLLAIMQAAKKADDSLLRDYAETTVAVADIKIAVRSMKTGKNKDFMKRAMAECNTLDIDRLATAAVAGMEEIERYLADTAYAGGAEALSESASAFERWCDNRIIETIKPQKYNPFTVGPIVAYILARLNEIKTVRDFRASRTPLLTNNLFAYHKFCMRNTARPRRGQVTPPYRKWQGTSHFLSFAAKPKPAERCEHRPLQIICSVCHNRQNSTPAE